MSAVRTFHDILHESLTSCARGAADSDGVIHLAFRQVVGFTGHMDVAVALDSAAIQALGETLAGTDRPVVVVIAPSLDWCRQRSRVSPSLSTIWVGGPGAR